MVAVAQKFLEVDCTLKIVSASTGRLVGPPVCPNASVQTGSPSTIRQAAAPGIACALIAASTPSLACATKADAPGSLADAGLGNAAIKAPAMPPLSVLRFASSIAAS